MYNVYKILPCIKEIWNATKCRYTIDQKSNFRFEFYYISSKLINHRYPLQLSEFRFFHTNYWINNDLKLLIGSVRIEESRFLSLFYHLQQLWKDTFSLPSLTSSSTVFAKGLPRVSGNIEHNKPAISAKPPQSVVGPHHTTAPNKSAT